MKKLTIKQLKAMKPSTIFAKGFGYITHPYFNQAKNNLEPDGRSVKVKWVAIRGGGYHDWTIYHSLDTNFEKADFFDGISHLEASWQAIANLGAKLYNNEKIKELVPCDEETFELYRL